VAVKDQRFLVYTYDDQDAADGDGRPRPRYMQEPSPSSDGGYWGALAYKGSSERVVGASVESVMRYAVTLDQDVPVTTDSVLVLLPAGTLRLKVQGVGLLPTSRELQADCYQADDEVLELATG
jgi:hypothetical protein